MSKNRITEIEYINDKEIEFSCYCTLIEFISNFSDFDYLIQLQDVINNHNDIFKGTIMEFFALKNVLNKYKDYKVYGVKISDKSLMYINILPQNCIKRKE